LLSLFLIGLFGSVHCFGMCGGIVGAFSLSGAQRQALPIKVAGQGLQHVLAFNAGRIASYMIAGALLGGFSGSLQLWFDIAYLQKGGYLLANLMLVLLGLTLMGRWQGLSWLETLGTLVWRRIQPGMKYLLPADRPLKALLLGSLWGWVPCGMVYSVLMTAMLSSSAWTGAQVMLAFGLGTLPALLSMGLLGQGLGSLARRPGVRTVAGLMVLVFGLLGLIKTVRGVSLGWLDAVCISQPAMSSLPASQH
jgi:sulfite exporter TauE/SafE